METEKRTVYFDNDLNIEAYHFEGIMQKFPNHFHEHYVIGFVESGQRFLTCKNKEYVVKAGDLLLFNPLDAHTCEQADGKPLDWRCLNIVSTIRVNRAKELLEEGTAPVEASAQSGFSDQSHFTRFFKTFIGLTPKQYQSLFQDGKGRRQAGRAQL